MNVVVDIDSTLFPLLDAMRLVPGGERVNYEECWEWTSLNEMCTRPVDDIIHDAMQPDVAAEVGLYPGAKEAMDGLATDGVKIEIVTHRHERYWDITSTFLSSQGLGDFPLLVGEDVCKITRLQKRGGGILVDDAPHVLEEAAQRGARAIAFAHLYNRQVRTDYSIPGASTWPELLEMIRLELIN